MQGSINRRNLLKMGGALASIGALRSAHGKTPVTRAAVVVGVDHCGSLPILNDAAASAQAFARWLKGEGFDVREFTDSDKKPVVISDVKKAVFDYVRLGSVQQLLIYFSGHGFKVGPSEFWMLSDALSDSNEAVTLRASLDAALLSGISNIFIVSDACRSTSTGLSVNQLHGGVLFPTEESNATSTFDCFYATLPGKAAFELPLTDSVKAYDGVFTSTFLEAYVDSPSSLVVDVNGVKVVDNHRLKFYLPDEVQRRVEKKTIKFTQRPYCPCNSDSPTYIGRVRTTGKPQQASLPVQASVADVARFELNNQGLWTHRSASPAVSQQQILVADTQSGFRDYSNVIRRISAAGQDAPVQFETQTGFVVFGATVKAFRALNPASRPELLSNGNGDDKAAILRVQPQASSVFIEFANGASTVLAALPGFIGRILVRGSAVDDVAYVPSRNTSRWLAQPKAVEELRELHATVASAADQGVFQIEGNSSARLEQASDLINQIRLAKGADPTLALYSAYALADAGMRDSLKELSSLVRSDLGEELFDLAMLAGRLTKSTVIPLGPVTPVCPMFTRGWELLRVRQVKVMPAVEKAGRYILPSATWTTFRPEGTNLIASTFS